MDIIRRFKGIQANGWKASSIRRYSRFKQNGKRKKRKKGEFMFVADLKKGDNTIHYTETVKNLQTFRNNIKKDAHRFDEDFD